MRLFSRSAELAPETVPANHTAMLCKVFDLPPDAKFLGDEAPEWITQEEAERQQKEWERNRPSVEELMQDPNVRAVVEAFTDDAVTLDLAGN